VKPKQRNNNNAKNAKTGAATEGDNPSKNARTPATRAGDNGSKQSGRDKNRPRLSLKNRVVQLLKGFLQGARQRQRGN